MLMRTHDLPRYVRKRRVHERDYYFVVIVRSGQTYSEPLWGCGEPWSVEFMTAYSDILADFKRRGIIKASRPPAPMPARKDRGLPKRISEARLFALESENAHWQKMRVVDEKRRTLSADQFSAWCREHYPPIKQDDE